MTIAAFTEEAGTPSPVFSEGDIADRFAKRHSGQLRYVAKWGQWMRYDGKVWLEEDTLMAFDLVRALCREIARECNKSNEAKGLLSSKTIAGVERIAKADRRIAATIDQWDTDPWLLNTPDCVIDLRTGKTRSHRPEDYVTRVTAVGVGGDCPLWKQHLSRIMNHDADLLAFLQRALGYSLTGSTREHALFFGHGGGGNGKGTTIETVTRLLGNYARTAPMEVFTYAPSAGDRHPTELAMLRGARFVTASETEAGRGWAESKIKTLTGGDRITARFMRQDFFEYIPQFKLWLTGNHKPGLRTVDEAIRRRFHLIPFTVTIAKADQDQELPAKLEKEWPGILTWMVEGCEAWQREGLKTPATVVAATNAYLAGEDLLKRWFADHCELGGKRDAQFTAALYANWKAWTEFANEYPGTMKKFSMTLEARSEELGIEKDDDLRIKDKHGEKHGRGFRGIKTLKPAVF
jgi:putative DNA primase/helicase